MSESKKSPEEVMAIAMLHYKKHGRSFPWRETEDPYRILVSECMLQQTQVARVIEKFPKFIKSFPTVRDLSEADRRSVLGQWSGLGYNRRAIALINAAKIIRESHGGAVPEEKELLRALPGVGEYTAAAVRVFAFNKPEVVCETNIRTVAMHHCMRGRRNIDDNAVKKVIGEIASRAWAEKIPPRALYSGLMDYGAYLKSIGIRINGRSKHYAKQKKFIGSARQKRGEAIRLLVQSKGGITEKRMRRLIGGDAEGALDGLVRDGLIEKRKATYRLVR